MFRNWRWIASLIVFVILISSGCRTTSPTQQSTKLNIELSPPGTTVGTTQLQLTITDTAGKPVENAKVQVVGDMTHAGMAPVTSSVEGGQGADPTGKEGKYTLPFTWSMGGDWILTIKVTLPDGTSETRTFNYTVKN